jgi:hypothetical protein
MQKLTMLWLNISEDVWVYHKAFFIVPTRASVGKSHAPSQSKPDPRCVGRTLRSLYAQGRISIGKACELAEMSLWEFRQLLAFRRISPGTEVVRP